MTETPDRLLRLFIAIVLPDRVKVAIEEAQADLRSALRSSRIAWTRREQFHLTLKFLGDVEAQRVADLAGAVRRACGRFAPLRLRAQGMGFFPDQRLPRVVWVEVRDSQAQLGPLQGAARVACRGFGADEGGEVFRGHVTLGRIKGICRAEAEILNRVARGAEGKLFGDWTADRIEIMRSELLAQGPRHTPLFTILLEGGDPPCGGP